MGLLVADRLQGERDGQAGECGAAFGKPRHEVARLHRLRRLVQGAVEQACQRPGRVS